MTAVVGVVVLGGVGAQAAPLPEPAEVTGAWVCESQGHRATDFRVFDDSAARFAIPAFTTSLGEFRRVDVTLGLDLTTSMAMTLEMAQAETQVRIDALHEIWMNIPPADVTPNFAPVGTARDDNLVVELPIAWADGIYDAGFTDFGTRTWSESVGFSSTDATVWAASGPQVVVMQTLTGLDVFGIAGNGTYTQLTTAAAEVCHRYTYLTLADEVEQVPPPAPEPPEQPAQP